MVPLPKDEDASSVGSEDTAEETYEWDAHNLNDLGHLKVFTEEDYQNNSFLRSGQKELLPYHRRHDRRGHLRRSLKTRGTRSIWVRCPDLLDVFPRLLYRERPCLLRALRGVSLAVARCRGT